MGVCEHGFLTCDHDLCFAQCDECIESLFEFDSWLAIDRWADDGGVVPAGHAYPSD